MIQGAGIILFKNNKILILKSVKGHYDFPKGHVEPGESLLEAAIREFEEETGLDHKHIKIIEDKQYVIEYYVKEHGEIDLKRVTFFLAEYLGEDDIRISKEHESYVWLDLNDDLEKAFKYRQHKELVKKILKDIRELQKHGQ